MNSLKRITKSILKTLGYRITKMGPIDSEMLLINKINDIGIDLFLDVGANTGQTAEGILTKNFNGTIISFEPLEIEYSILLKKSKEYSNWIVAPRSAVGDYEGEIELNVGGNSGSSSILSMMESHLEAAPESKYIGKQSVPMITLDKFLIPYLSNHKKVMLKIDTQGYEWQVLMGAQTIMPSIKAITLELSIIELYKGQKLWKELIEFIESMNFSLWSIEQGFSDPKTGRVLQIDATFFR